VFVGPTSGNAAAPAFRKLVAEDLPSHSTDLLTAGILPIARGGSGLSSTSAHYVFIGQTNQAGAPSWRELVESDIPTISITSKTSGTLTVARGGTGIT